MLGACLDFGLGGGLLLPSRTAHSLGFLERWWGNGIHHLFHNTNYKISVWDCSKSTCSCPDVAPASRGGRISLPKIPDQLYHPNLRQPSRISPSCAAPPAIPSQQSFFFSLWVTKNQLLVGGGCWISWIGKISTTNKHGFLCKDLTSILHEYIKCRLSNHRVDNNIDF